jgi:NADPH-dependent ferric siderophore reductase
MRESEAALRVRKAPPPFRRAAVERVERLSGRMLRVTLAGPGMVGFPVPDPAASVRLLLPFPGEDLVLPDWVGNNFLMADGRRPIMRTFTPQNVDPEAGRIDLDIVEHDEGAACGWAAKAEPGWEAAISGPLKGYAIDSDAPGFLLAGDESAIPAIGQLLAALPDGTPVEVHVEITDAAAELALPDHPRADVRWHQLGSGSAPGDAIVAAVTKAEIAEGTRIWVAGEAASVQRIRKHLFDTLGIPRPQTVVRGYWKHGRAEGDAEAD